MSVDGGVFANNPAMCAYVTAIEQGAHPYDIMIVSLGTGVSKRPIPYDDAKDWGRVGWTVPIIDVIFDGVADAANYQFQHLLPQKNDVERYFRFNTRLNTILDDMGAANRGNIEALKREAQEILDDDGDFFDRLRVLLS